MENKQYKEGLYFGMPEEEYHAIPYFSRSLMGKLGIDEEEAWQSLHSEKPKEETEAMKLGTAIHCAILEPELFEKKYCGFLDIEKFNGKTILKSSDDIKNFLVSVGEKKTGTKPELIQRALPYIDPDKYTIWDNEKLKHEKANAGKIILNDINLEIIEEIKEAIKRRPQIEDFLKDGYPEVVIIWKDTETGIMCKCRVDYLKTDAIGELKSFALKRKKNIFKACCDEIVYQEYNLQFAVYSKAVETIVRKLLIGEAEIFGDVDQNWIDELMKTQIKPFSIIFLRTGAPYQCTLIEMNRAEVDGATDNLYYSEANYWYRKALKIYKNNKEKPHRWINRDYMKKLLDMHVPGVQYQYKTN